MALAYLIGKGSSKALHTKINIPVILVLSILPDIDIAFDFITGAEIHRGPFHSVVAAALVFIPFFIKYRKTAIPYFLALISHPLIGDFLIGGKLQLLWPLTNQQFGLHEVGGPFIDIFSPANIVLEMLLFLLATAVLLKSGDWRVFFTNKKTNLVLIIPIATVLLPSTVGYPFTESLLLNPSTAALGLAHLFYLVIFTIAVVLALAGLFGYKKQLFQNHTGPA
jgi:hypothetical protein